MAEEQRGAGDGSGADRGNDQSDGPAESLVMDREEQSAAEELEVIQSELNAMNDRHLRLAAEFDNYRKRNERERSELWTRAQAELAKRILDVLDDLQRVAHFDASPTNAQALVDGVQLVEKKFRSILESAGLEAIDVEGENYNPEAMEALLTIATDNPDEDEQVASVLQPGYRFKGLLLRPAKVQVKKHER